MDLQSKAQKQSLRDSPRTALPENTKGIDLQCSALKPKGFQAEPSTVRYGANTKSGEFQISGDKIKLSDKPTLGYESANTPMSNRAVDSKKSF